MAHKVASAARMAGAIALIVISLGAIVAGRGYTSTARRMRTFATARGTVLEKRAIPLPSGDTTTGRWGKGGGYHPYVKYRYEVDGRTYTHDKVSYALHGLKQELVEHEELGALGLEAGVEAGHARPIRRGGGRNEGRRGRLTPRAKLRNGPRGA